MERKVSGTVLIVLLIGISVLTTNIQKARTVAMHQSGFRTVSSLNDPENPSVSAFLDILQVTVETDDFTLLRLNMTLRGAPPDSHAFVNRTLDDNLSYAWWIDADRNSSTGQHHQYAGSEYNIMTQVSGGSPTGEWGARVDVTGSMPGGGAVQFAIKENMISLLVGLSQIGNPNSFDYSVATWGRLNGSSLGYNPETITQTVDLNDHSNDRSVLLLINEDIYPMIVSSLCIFEQDLEDEGYKVVNATVSSTTSPPEIKDIIKSFHQSTGNLEGAILIGKIKAAYLEIFTGSTDPQTHEVSVYKSLDACDMYYMDLDGIWEHVANPDFEEDKPPNVAKCYKYASCDTFRYEYIVYLDEEEKEWDYSQIVNKDQFKAEIWVSRIMAHNLKIPGKSEAQIINDYFQRNHNFRAAGKIASKAYMLAAWQETGPGAYQSMDFSTVFENMTKADNVSKRDYLNYLEDPEGSKLFFLGAHSGPQSHALYDGSVTTDELVGKNKTSAFYLLNACSSCRWDQSVSSPSDPNYLGGLYVFDTSPSRKNNGLGAIGFTGVGGFNWLNYFSDYLGMHADASFGDAYTHWFNSMLVQFMCCWPPGALNYVYLGDPTIGPKHPIKQEPHYFYNSIKIDDPLGDATAGAPPYVDIISLEIRQIGQYVQFAWEANGNLFNNDDQYYFIVLDTDFNPKTGQYWGGAGGELKIAIYQTAALIYFDQMGNVIQDLRPIAVVFEGNKYYLNVEKGKIPSDRFNLYFESSGGTPYGDSGSLLAISLQPSREEIDIIIDSENMVLDEKPPLVNIPNKKTPVQLKTYISSAGSKTELQHVCYNVSHPVAHDPRLGDPSSIISVYQNGTATYLREGYVFVTSYSREYYLCSQPVIIATGTVYGNPETDNVLAVFPEDYQPEMSSYSFGYMMSHYPDYIKTVNFAYDLMGEIYVGFKPFDGDKQIFALLVLAGHCGGNNNPLETAPCCYINCGNGEPQYNVVIHEMGHNFAATKGMEKLTTANGAKIGSSGFGEGVASLPVIYFAKDLYDHPEKYGFDYSSFEWQYYKTFLEQDIPYCKGQLENFENMIIKGQTKGIFDNNGKFDGVAVFCSLFQQYAYEFTNDTNPYKQEVIRRFLNLFPDKELALFEDDKVETYFAAAFSTAVGHDMKEKLKFWGFSIDDAYYNQVYAELSMPSTDLNQDGAVNILDITIVAAAYNTKTGDEKWNALADLDRNGTINILDVTMVAKDYGKTV